MKHILSSIGLIVGTAILAASLFGAYYLFEKVFLWVLKSKIILSIFPGFLAILFGAIVIGLACTTIAIWLTKLTTYKQIVKWVFGTVAITIGVLDVSDYWPALDFSLTKGILAFIYLLVGAMLITICTISGATKQDFKL